VLGGRLAAERLGAQGREAAFVGVAAGVVFALLIGMGTALSTVTVGYGAAFGDEASAGWVIAGPNVVTGTLLAAAWGIVGGGVGAATKRRVRDLTPLGSP